jgi:hypothetical protein
VWESLVESKIKALIKTVNFEYTATTVFNRLIHADGPGLFVLWGGYPGDVKKTNKSYFLDMVEIFEKEIPESTLNMFSENLHNVLQQIEPGRYQCVRVVEDTHLAANENVYAVPLSITVPLAIAGAVNRKGFKDGGNLVILCDDLQKFMEYNHKENETYLRQLSLWLNRQSLVTFLGTSQLTWNAKATLDSDPINVKHVLPLGWD